MTTTRALKRTYMVMRTQKVNEGCQRMSLSDSKYFDFTCQLDEAVAHDDNCYFPVSDRTTSKWYREGLTNIEKLRSFWDGPRKQSKASGRQDWRDPCLNRH